MEKYLTFEHFEKYLSALTTKSFTEFCERLLYKLYNFTYEEVKIIDPEIEKIISKEDYINFIIRV